MTSFHTQEGTCSSKTQGGKFCTFSLRRSLPPNPSSTDALYDTDTGTFDQNKSCQAQSMNSTPNTLLESLGEFSLISQTSQYYYPPPPSPGEETKDQKGETGHAAAPGAGPVPPVSRHRVYWYVRARLPFVQSLSSHTELSALGASGHTSFLCVLAPRVLSAPSTRSTS